MATNSELTFDNFQTASVLLATDNTSVTVSTTFNPPLLEPLLPGEVSGLDVTPFTDSLRELLQPGEMVNPSTSNSWRWQINFTPEFVGDVTLHTTLEIDNSVATFDTQLRFSPSFETDIDPLVIVQSQRVSAIPEPSGAILLLTSLLISLRFRTTRKIAIQLRSASPNAVAACR